jgi:hypothetical protein
MALQSVPGVGHSYPESIVQVAEHPSEGVSFPSSHASGESIIPFEQIFRHAAPMVGHSQPEVKVHIALHPSSGESLIPPSSHISPWAVFRTPFPQTNVQVL